MRYKDVVSRFPSSNHLTLEMLPKLSCLFHKVLVEVFREFTPPMREPSVSFNCLQHLTQWGVGTIGSHARGRVIPNSLPLGRPPKNLLRIVSLIASGLYNAITASPMPRITLITASHYAISTSCGLN